MKPMIRRLRLLEQAFMVSDEVDFENTPAAIVRARRMRRLAQDGSCVPPEKWPRLEYWHGMSIADILRLGRWGARQPASEVAL
jgi:hypothetical protein